jgi:small subunit ribosomal protein S1
VLEGRVLKISGADVFIDVGSKSDGVAPLSQFTDAQGAVTVRPGDVVDVMIESGRTSEGYVVLSHERAARLKVWDNLENALQQQLTISGLVLGRVKGGLSVDVGVHAFMPGSQVDVRPMRNLDQFTGQNIPAFQKASRPIPFGLTAPTPVTTTRRLTADLVPMFPALFCITAVTRQID